MAVARVLLLLLLGAAVVSALRKYQDEIPNIPSVKGSAWNGVGHVNAAGGGDRNSFGKVRCGPT